MSLPFIANAQQKSPALQGFLSGISGQAGWSIADQ
jgi:hypothetical protein